MNKKICVITATRAEYGLLYWLMKEIQNDKELELQLIVTGTHLAREFGYTVKEIEKEFKIDKKIDIEVKGADEIDICNSMSKAQMEFAKAYKELQPDFVVVLGDRYELIPIVSSAVIFNIPVVHLHGGEITKGAVDEYFRHAITKMSYLHFTSTEEYKKRVIQMGEEPHRVFCIGAMGIENIYRLNLLSKKELSESLGINLDRESYLITYHPTTLNKDIDKEINELLEALDEINATLIFTKANADTKGKLINKKIEEFTKKKKNAYLFDSLGQLRYLSLLQFITAIIGNSSSGIIEAPSFKIPTINIGNRQEGRIKAKSIIDCKCKKEDILNALDKAKKMNLTKIKNPYEKEKFPSKEIIKILKNFKVKNIKKNFYDINC
jgi:GDP/UDP-N,N'-diacetylbacillosamine 2-epimerase (hydrolysing)